MYLYNFNTATHAWVAVLKLYKYIFGFLLKKNVVICHLSSVSENLIFMTTMAMVVIEIKFSIFLTGCLNYGPKKHLLGHISIF
jgi:hypothetical protein